MLMFRSTHKALMAANLREIARLVARVEAVESRHDALVRSLTDAATRQVEARTPAPPKPKREPDEVDTAIDWKAQGNVAVRRHLERFAKGERAAGKEPKDIAASIMQGDRVADDVGVDL